MELPETAVIHNCFEKVVAKQKGCFGRVNKKKHLVNSDKLGDGLSQLRKAKEDRHQWNLCKCCCKSKKKCQPRL